MSNSRLRILEVSNQVKPSSVLVVWNDYLGTGRLVYGGTVKSQ